MIYQEVVNRQFSIKKGAEHFCKTHTKALSMAIPFMVNLQDFHFLLSLQHFKFEA